MAEIARRVELGAGEVKADRGGVVEYKKSENAIYRR
jgi:hypothetical protein